MHAPKQQLMCVPRREITARDINEANSITIFNHTIDESVMLNLFYRSLKQFGKNGNIINIYLFLYVCNDKNSVLFFRPSLNFRFALVNDVVFKTKDSELERIHEVLYLRNTFW